MNNLFSGLVTGTATNPNGISRWRRSKMAIGASILMLLVEVTAARAATWYLQANQSSSENWNTLSDWYSQPFAGGSHPSLITGSDNFDLNGYAARMPAQTSGTLTFPGSSLVLNGGEAGLLWLRTSAPAVALFPNMVSNGGKIWNYSSVSGVLPLSITNLTNIGNTTFSTYDATRGLNITIGTISGSGDLCMLGVGGGSILLNVGSAAKFYGTLYIADGCQFTFQNAITSSGALDVGAGTSVTLNYTATFCGLSVSGTAMSGGTYSAAALGFSGTGCVVVGPPASWYLHAAQPATDDWNTLADWFSSPAGGTNPLSISGNDNYFTNGYCNLRTPATSSDSTFGGALLTMASGTAYGGVYLQDTSNSTAVSIPNFCSMGGIISVGKSVIENLNVSNFTNLGPTIFDTAASTRGLNINLGVLSGTGDFTMDGRGGGNMSINISDAYNYTGKINFDQYSSSVTTFPSDIFTAGSLEFGAGNVVNLNSNLTVTGLKVSSVAKPVGTYAASSLSFSGTGNITVVNRPARMFGVNLPGGGFAGTAKYPTQAAQWDYYHGKGMNLVRIAFIWERVQPTLYGALNTTAMSNLDTILSLANARGMKVILDMHNYDRYTIGGGTTAYLIGTTQVPYAAYQDVWQKLANHFVAAPNAAAIYGYDIMNEPYNTGTTWATAAQYGVNGVRQSDSVHYVIVEGDGYASASNWMTNNANLNVNDPAGRLIYSAHCYWDSGAGGAYGGTYDSNHAYPNIGVDRVSSFVRWLKLRKAWGLIGEYGVPTNVASPDPRWNIVIDNFLYYLQSNGVSGTYWAGGQEWTPTYPLLCTTGTNPIQGCAVMNVLQNYH